MQKKRISTKVLSVVLSLLMMLTIIPLVPFTSTADAAYANEYYHAEKRYIKDVAMVYFKSASQGYANLQNAVGHNAGTGYALNQDLTAGTGGTYYVYIGWTWTTNPAEAVRGFRLDHNGGMPANWNQSGVMWYPVNSGNHAWVPQLHGDGCVDTNKGAGGDDIKVYITKDPSFGPPLTNLYRAGSYTERDNYINAGWVGVVSFQDNSYIVDLNKGAGGDDLFFVYEKDSSYTKVNTSALRSAYTNSDGFIGKDGYTPVSIGELSDARSAAKTIMDAFDNNGGYAHYTQAQIDSAATRLNNAVNNLKTFLYLDGKTNGGTENQTIEVTVGRNKTATVNLGNYTATKAGADFVGWSKGSLDMEGTTGTVTVGFNETYYALFGVELTANFHYLTTDGTYKLETKKMYAMNSAKTASTPKPSAKDANYDGRTFTFLGWREDTTAADATITKSGIYTVNVANPVVNVYAVYSSDITFTQDANKGTPTIEPQTQNQYLNANSNITVTSHEFTVTDVTPEREGGQFLGWADSANETAAQYTTGYKFTLTSDKTIYAIYKLDEWDVTFIGDNGEIIDTQTIKHGDDAAYPETVPAKNYDENYHYVFANWDKALEELKNIKAHVTVNAVFNAIEHTYTITTTTAPDCINAGEDHYACDCGYSKDVAVDALGHIEVIQAAQEATCTMGGISEKITCQRCQKVLKEAIATEALGHEFELSESRPATCEVGGYSIYHCTHAGCEFTEKRDVTAPTGIHVEEALKGWAATCTVNGMTDGSECAQCGAVIDAQHTIFAKHSIATLAPVNPTCTETGLTAGEYCTVEGCDYKVEQEVVPALGHEWRGVSGLAATCTTAGYTASSICINCNTVKDKEIIPALEHDYVATVTEPTCTSKGYTTYVCANDAKHTYVDNYTAVLEHTGGTATCKEYAKCDVCGQKYGKLASHNYETVVVAPTCTEKGYTKYICTVCEYSYEADRTNKIAHDYDDGVITTAPGCTTTGTKTYTCVNCPETYTVTLEANGHDITWEVIDGIAYGTCANCDEQFDADPEDVGIEVEVPECERCGMAHTATSGFFKYDGIYCKIVAFFRQILNFFKGA